MQAFLAAVAGAYIHAQAGLKAAKTIGGSAGVLAGDLVEFVPGIIKK
jgi:NAD(P)H-hydrate repair Nnr-like enzyme with NAD(P)H-hydrate dehydratase domain